MIKKPKNAVPLQMPKDGHLPRLTSEKKFIVVGGGLAGAAAATVLAERGGSVLLLEREAYLGGRLGAWTDHLEDGEPFDMERGFHAFFRQYYNLRNLLRRVDPTLSRLRPLEDYPVIAPNGETAKFSGIPKTIPWNFIEIVRRNSSIDLSALIKIDKRAAFEMLRFSLPETPDRFDHHPAKAYLDALNFPDDARRLLFDVFAHSFFNPESSMSAAELLMMFHYYFLANPEGLLFDVLDGPFSTALWRPLADYMTLRGVELRTQHEVEQLTREREGWRVHARGADGKPLTFSADAVVLALPVPGLKKLVERSPDLSVSAWRAQLDHLDVTLPFAVWRLWLDRPVREDRAPFIGTVGHGIIDNISLFHLFEDESRAWAKKTGGAVVELHAYAVAEDLSEDAIKKELLDSLHTFYPETRDAKILEDRYIKDQDCPAFSVGDYKHRPTVETPFEDVMIAGDFVRLPIPSALMERAVTSGMYAANMLLARDDVRGEQLWSIPPRGPLASWPESFYRVRL